MDKIIISKNHFKFVRDDFEIMVLWEDVIRITVDKYDCIDYEAVILSLDLENGDFIELINDCAGFKEFTEELCRKFNIIHFSMMIQDLTLESPSKTVWERKV